MVRTQASAADPVWFKDAVIYELHVKTFFDGNNDGIGDFAGLMQKLDYLQELGVTCLWLLPFFPSPLRDDGYDIAEYTSVHPSYGTLDDFHAFLDAAHERGLQVMVELVINHTSDQHPWFQRARHAPAGSPERDFYVWSDTDQRYKDARIIFTDTEKSNWTWDPAAKAYYWHRFFSHQPDLNYDNPAVIDEVIRVMRFWLDMGVDGLRLDAIPYLIERDGTNCENLPETHTAIKQIRKAMDELYANRMILAEANQWPSDVREYFGEGDECHMAFHFPLMPRLFMSLRLEDRHPIIDIIEQTPEIPSNCQWGLFLRNHDELTLEMVTDEERDYMYFAYSADPQMRINVGIRRRLAPLMENNRRRIELLNSILFSFPGTPILYYGDELGMGDNIYLGDRNGVRTPMQWNADRNAGFSRCAPARLYSPVILDPIYGYEAINVEVQQSDSSSLLHWMRHMIALRKLFQVFGRGSIEFLHPANRKILAYVRKHGDEQILCVANLSRFAQPFDLDLSSYAGMTPVEMLGYVEFPKIGREHYPLTLGPYAFLWFELHGKPEVLSGEEDGLGEEPILLPAGGFAWDRVLSSSAKTTLETRVLPIYLPKQRWFGSKSREIRGIEVKDWAAIGRSGAVLMLVEVQFADLDSEVYCLPVALSSAEQLQRIGEGAVASALCSVQAAGETRVLYDATWNPEANRELFGLMRGDATLPMRIGSVQPEAGALLRQTRQDEDALSVRRGTAEQSNTSIIFGGRYILKLFRKLSAGVNPDCEIGKYLTENAGFHSVPAFGGALTYMRPAMPQYTLAMAQGLVENQGDGWQATLEELGRYYERCLAWERAAPSTDAKPQTAYLDAARELTGIYRDSAASLGRTTAQMHIALAGATDVPAFAPEPFTDADRLKLAQDLRAHAGTVFDSLRNSLSRLPDELLEEASYVLGLRRKIWDRLSQLEKLNAHCLKTRVHGDYHLGQVLRVENEYVILDFEGEPSRSIEERRAKQLPLKDVAGMLRSFGYAARAALFNYTARRPEDIEQLEPWAKAWEKVVADIFLQSYRETAADAAFLPRDDAAFRGLLDGFILDKALYELRYELNNRPAWVSIPLSGILSLRLNGAGANG